MGKKAVAAEKDKDYQEAYNQYQGACKVFMHLIKCKSNYKIDKYKTDYWYMNVDEQNPNIKQIYKEKMSQYLDRAEYIKKQVLSTPEHQIVPQA